MWLQTSLLLIGFFKLFYNVLTANLRLQKTTVFVIFTFFFPHPLQFPECNSAPSWLKHLWHQRKMGNFSTSLLIRTDVRGEWGPLACRANRCLFRTKSPQLGRVLFVGLRQIYSVSLCTNKGTWQEETAFQKDPVCDFCFKSLPLMRYRSPGCGNCHSTSSRTES